jgi:hypothetical protein
MVRSLLRLLEAKALILHLKMHQTGADFIKLLVLIYSRLFGS